jgi:hypothetical protein
VFGEAGTTTSGILKLELPIGTRVMLTVLKKLYLQAGSGRKESALYRGLDQRERSMVSSVLGLLRSQELAVPTKVSQQSVWIPVRAATGRVRKIIAQPNTCGDVSIVKSAELES